jgi:Flp pilus assembly protein TadG
MNHQPVAVEHNMETDAKTRGEQSNVLTNTLRRGLRRKTRGQSLIEFAMSATVLILLLSGIIDLGRAFFTVITLHSVISEGAHWAAAYPGCVPTASDTTPTDLKCQGTNSVVGRMLSETTNLDSQRITEVRVEPLDVSQWQNPAYWSTDGTPSKNTTVKFKISYTIDTIMPLTYLFVGRTMTLSAEAQEVVRGEGKPSWYGGGLAQFNIPRVPSPSKPTNGTQSGSSCNNGIATLQWDAQIVTGYYVFANNTDTTAAQALKVVTNATNPVTTTVSVGSGNTTTFYVRSYNDNGSAISVSDPVAITAACLNVQPTNFSAACRTDGNGLNLTWTASPNDSSIVGYMLIRNTPTLMQKTTQLFTSNGMFTASGSFLFDAPTDYTAATWSIAAVNSTGGIVGSASTSTTAITCVPSASAPTSAPSGLAWSGSCYNGNPQLRWTQMTGVTGYKIYSTANTTTPIVTISSNYTATPPNMFANLTSPGSYTYYIRAYNQNGVNQLEGPQSANVVVSSTSCPTLASLTPPTMTAECTGAAAPGPYTGARISWNAYSGDLAVTQVRLYRNGVSTPIGTYPSGSPQSVVLSPFAVTADKTATYNLRLLVGSTEVGQTDVETLACGDPAPILQISNARIASCAKLQGNNGQNRTFEFYWQGATDTSVTQYRVTSSNTSNNVKPNTFTWSAASTLSNNPATYPPTYRGVAEFNSDHIAATWTIEGLNASGQVVSGTSANVNKLVNTCTN